VMHKQVNATRQGRLSGYFLPFACLAGSETCFLSFLFWSFSRCNFLCCSKPAAFFSFLDNTYSPKTYLERGDLKLISFALFAEIV
jgi:hypothetical protein